MGGQKLRKYAVLHVVLGRERGKQRALGDLDLKLRDIDAVERGEHGGILRRAKRDRGVYRRKLEFRYL